MHVIMLTAMGQKTDRDRGLAAGADHFVTKPFDEDGAAFRCSGASRRRS